MSGISADESRDFSPTLLVDPVRGDTLARAAEHRRQELQTIIRRLAQGLSPVYTRRPKPDQISCQLDQHTTDERSNKGKVGIKFSTFNLISKHANEKQVKFRLIFQDV